MTKGATRCHPASMSALYTADSHQVLEHGDGCLVGQLELVVEPTDLVAPPFVIDAPGVLDRGDGDPSATAYNAGGEAGLIDRDLDRPGHVERDGRWFVAMPAAPPDSAGQRPEANGQSAGHAPDTTGHPPDLAAQLAAVTADRDWLRSRVEELTTIVNRQQEIMLRQAPDQHRLAARVAVPLSDDHPPTPAPAARKLPLWKAILRRLVEGAPV
jgi:hypothetical protein